MEELSADAIPTTSESTSATHSLFSTLFISIVSCLFSIGCCYFALFSISFRHGLINSASKIVELQSECLKPIPSKFFLSSSCILPCKTFTPIPEAKWVNAVVFSLESQYRFQGISLQFLEVDEYVSFSENHYAFYASEAMNVDASRITEKIGQVYDNDKFIIYGAPENIVFFNNQKYSFDRFLSSGPKNKNVKKDFIFSQNSAKESLNLKQKMKSKSYFFNQTIMPEKASKSEDATTNPLEYGFSSVKRIVGIETIKRALISSSNPIPVAFQLPSQIFYKEINESTNFKKGSGCTIYDSIENHHESHFNSQKSLSYPCPFNSSKQCHKFILYPPSSILVNKNAGDPDYDEHYTSYGNPVVMALVGYNDNFILHLNSTSFLKGGFIMRSVFMNNEHSREYFMNEITSFQELKLCHDDSDPYNWPIATSVKCIEETKKASSCGSIEFECLNDMICDTTMNYTYFGGNNFIQWGNGVEPHIITIEFPRNFLYYIIKPKQSQKSDYSRNQFCGYSFIPFKVVEDMYLKNLGPFSFDAADIQVKWAPYSYYSKKNSEKKYQKLKDSTYKIETLVKHLPYDEVEL